MDNPYLDLPAKAFWRTAVADRDMMEISGLWAPKFPIQKNTRIATFGSCFAQHFGRSLRAKGFGWFDAEPAPRYLESSNKKRFNYEVFSARTGNVYTTSQLKQWAAWAVGLITPPNEVWEKNGRFYDPFRPRIEPNGFETVREMERARDVTIEAMNLCARRANVFVFTMGLTEAWFNRADGYEYPMCPGTAGGEFDDKKHVFERQSYDTVLTNLREAIALLRGLNQNLNFLLTVSPVPLTATNSGAHVLAATSASKAILRAVAETVSQENAFVDYFPSYEIINAPVFKGAFFEKNLRSVSQIGVDFVMKSFFDSLENAPEASSESEIVHVGATDKMDDLLCDEELLNAYAPGPKKP